MTLNSAEGGQQQTVPLAVLGLVLVLALALELVLAAQVRFSTDAIAGIGETPPMNTGDAIARFTHEAPTISSYWRAIILFGQNVASYKFALAGALLELGSESELISLDDLAVPFARRVAGHLRTHDKQGTFERSRFLDACRSFNAGDLDGEGLRAKTVQLGFANVIDAFHVVDKQQLPERFFLDERRTGQGIRLTDHLHTVAGAGQASTLDQEVESRWQLVETAWELNLPKHLLTVEFDPVEQVLLPARRRTAITGARGALNGYQKGRCFYCFAPVQIISGHEDLCEVDHVFAWSSGPRVSDAPVDGIWNLVLACSRCNGWHEKSDRPPHLRYVERLHQRNEFLISSHHPLRPTLIAQTGTGPSRRAATLRGAYDHVSVGGARAAWTAPEEMDPAF